MQIASTDIEREVLVIAEIGNNHEGDSALAAEMIHSAAEAGAGAVKFQAIQPDQLVSPEQEDRVKQLERFQLSREEVSKLAETARQCGVAFLSTPFYLDAVDELDPLVPAFKIASGDNNFIPLLEKVAATGKPVLLSCGIADLETIEGSQNSIRRVWNARGDGAFIVLLHCVSSYPTPPEHANLRAISALSEIADVVGYSDHTLGVGAAVASVALGARVIEKHFTLNKDFSDFRDHKLSADPPELKELCERVAEVNAMLGDGQKTPGSVEASMEIPLRRSIAAARDITADTVLTIDDITWLRPGDGIPAGQEKSVVGRRLKHAVHAGQFLSCSDFTESG